MGQIEAQRLLIQGLETELNEAVGQSQLETIAVHLQEARATLSWLLQEPVSQRENNTDVLATANHMVTAVGARDAANLEALTLLVDGLRLMIGGLATDRGIRIGEEYGETRYTPGLELMSYAREVSGGNIRAELDGYVLGLSPEGELIGGEVSGWWGDREGYNWSVHIVPVTRNEAARHVWADDVASHVERALRDRGVHALARSKKLLTLADELRVALRGVRTLCDGED